MVRGILGAQKSYFFGSFPKAHAPTTAALLFHYSDLLSPHLTRLLHILGLIRLSFKNRSNSADLDPFLRRYHGDNQLGSR